MKRLSNWLYAFSGGKLALGALAVFLLFGALVLPGQSALAAQYSGGLGSPDTSLPYSSQDLNAMAEAYGEAGREAYIRARFTFDLAFPLVYTFFFITSTSWLLGRTLPPASPWRLLNLLPLAAMLLDFLENTATTVVMARFPQPAPIAALLAPPFSLLKWVLVGASFLLLMGAGIAYLIHRKK